MRHCPPRLVCLFTVLALAGTTSVMANNETTTPPPSLPGLLSSFAGSKILLIGILDSDLIIITKDASPLVYDVPMVKFVKSKVDLYGLAPVELSSKWPALSGNANFTSTVQSSSSRPQSIFIKLDSEKFVYTFKYDYNANKRIIKTVTLSINPPSASYQEYGIEHGFDFLISNFITSTEQNVFFNLVIDPGNPHKLVKYVYQAGGFNPTMTSVMCKQLGTNGTEMIVFKDPKNSIDCTLFGWDIPNGGFVDQNRFHLFSHDTVYIFEYTGAGGANTAGVPVTAVKLSDFFVSITPTTTTTHSYGSSSKKAGVSTGIIIALVCGVLLVLGIIIAVVVWCKCYKKHPHPKDHKMKRSSSSRKGTDGQSQARVSSSQFPKLQSPSAQANNTSGLKNPTETRGFRPSSGAQQGATSEAIVKSADHDEAPTMLSTNEQMEHIGYKSDPYLLYDCHPKDVNGKRVIPSSYFDAFTPEMAQFMTDIHTETDPEKLKQVYLQCPTGPCEVPDNRIKLNLKYKEIQDRLDETEAQKNKKKKGSQRRRTSSGRQDSRHKVRSNQRTSSSKQQQQNRGKQTQKAKLAKQASKHSKAKASKGSVASRKPTMKKSSRRVASKGGRKASKASKGSNRKS